MKTKEDVSKEIHQLQDEALHLDVKLFKDHAAMKRHKQKLIKRIKFLRMVKMYLETSPSKESIASQAELVQKKIDSFNKDFYKIIENIKRSRENVDESKILSSLRKEHGFAQFKQHLDTLKYIAS